MTKQPMRRRLMKLVSSVAAVAILLTSMSGIWQSGLLTASAAAAPELFHDQSSVFMSNTEPAAGETLTIWLRTDKNAVSSARLIRAAASNGAETTLGMTKSSAHGDVTGAYDYWCVSFTVPSDAFYYMFSAVSSSRTYYLTQRPQGSVTSSPVSTTKAGYTYGWYMLPGFSTPDWAKGAAWYSLMPDAFFNGDTSNDDTAGGSNYDQPWDIEHNGLNDRYGGDFQGIINKAEYIKSLGIDAVFFNPVQKSEQNAGYGSSDFNQIDSTFGNSDKFKELISTLHGKDLRIMQDVAIYFTPNNSIYANTTKFWPNAGAYNSSDGSINPDSPYYGVISDVGNGGYASQWGGYVINNMNDVAASLIYSTPEAFLQRYSSISLGYGIDGYRFDCGGWITGHEGYTDDYNYTDAENSSGRHTNLQTVPIMKAIRSAVKNINPDTVILSESSGDSQLKSGAWDAEWQMPGTSTLLLGYIYQDKSPIGGAASLSSVREGLTRYIWGRLRGTAESNHIQLNTHDVSYVSFDASNRYRLMTAKLLQMTFVGSPSLYYGEETNFSMSSDRTGNQACHLGFSSFDWNEENWDSWTMSYTKSLLELRQQYPAIKTGALIELALSTDSYDYARFDESDSVLVLSNGGSSYTSKTVYARSANIASGNVLTDWFTGAKYTVGSNGYVTVSVRPGGTVLVTGGKTSSYRDSLGLSDIVPERTEATGLLGTYVRLLVNGADYSDSYVQNGSVSVAAGGNAVITGLKLDERSHFTLSGDVTFESHGTETGNDSAIGIQIGTCRLAFDSSAGKQSGIYRIGGVIRPNLTDYTKAQQTLTALTKGTGDARSVWLKVTGNLGPVATSGSVTVNLKLEYNNGIIKFYVNGVNCSGDGIDYRAAVKSSTGATVLDEKLSLGFFNDYSGTAFPFSLSNIKVTGDTPMSDACAVSGSNGSITMSYAGGSLGGSSDDLKFASEPVYNAFTSTSAFSNLTGSGLAMVRSSLEANSAFYAARVSGSTVSVLVRPTDGAVAYTLTTSAYSGQSVSIKRDKNNKFSLLLNGTAVSGSEINLAMPSKLYAGASVIGGTGAFTVSASADGKKYFDDFSGTTLSSMFNSGNGLTPSDGKLTLPSSGRLTSTVPAHDWTYKASLSYTPTTAGDWSGVIACQDESCYVVAGRTYLNGKVNVFLGKYIDGRLAIIASTEDSSPNSDIVVQLQRIGTSFTAVYSYDGVTWYDFDGAFVFANFSECSAGVACRGGATAVCDFVSFGSAISDMYSTNTPHTPSVDSLTFKRPSVSSYRLQTVSGNWTNSSEGFLQTVQSGVNQLAIPNVSFESFRVEATFKNETGTGSSGISFGKTSYSNDYDYAYSIRYGTDRKLYLYAGNSIITYQDVSNMPEELRIVAEYLNGRLIVYAGPDAVPLISAEINTKGYISFFTDGVTARVMNFNAGSYGATLYGYLPSVESSPSYIKLSAASSNYASVRNTAMTEYIISTKLTLSRFNDGDYEAGLILSSFMGSRVGSYDGLYVCVSSDGKLHLKKNGTDVCTPYTLDDITSDIVLLTAKQGKTYKVYVNYHDTPALTYTDSVLQGGAISVTGKNSSSTFSGLCSYELSANESIESTPIFKSWLDGQLGVDNMHRYDDDLSSSSTEKNYYAYTGSWEFKDGVLKNNDYSSWDAGITYTGSSYSDAIISFKMKLDSQGGYAGIGFRKASQSGNSNKDGVTLLVYHGSINFSKADTSASWAMKPLASVNVTTERNRWYSYTLVCVGSNVKLYRDGVFLLEYTDDEFMRGFVTFRYANSYVQFDDISLVPIHEAELPAYSSSDDIADLLTYMQDGSDITTSFMSSGSVTVTAGHPLTVDGITNSSASRYAVTYDISLSSITTGAFFDTVLGDAVVNGRLIQLIFRTSVKSAGTLSPTCQLGYINESGAFVTLGNTVTRYTSELTSCSVTVYFAEGILRLFINDSLILAEPISLSEQNVKSFSPLFGISVMNATAQVSNIKAYCGAVTEPENDVTSGISVSGKRGQMLVTDNTTELFCDVSYGSSLSIEGTFNAVKKTSAGFELGYLLGTCVYNGTLSDITAVAVPNSDRLYIRIGDTTVATATLKMKIINIGENVFDDSNPEALPLPLMTDVCIEASLSKNGMVKLHAECGPETVETSAQLSYLGATELKLKGGIVAKNAAATVKTWSVKGIGAEAVVTDNTVIDALVGDTVRLTSSSSELKNICYGTSLRMRGSFVVEASTGSSYSVGMTVGTAKKDGSTVVLSAVALPKQNKILFKYGDTVFIDTYLEMDKLNIGENEFDDRDNPSAPTASAPGVLVLEVSLGSTGELELSAKYGGSTATATSKLADSDFTEIQLSGAFTASAATVAVSDLLIGGVGVYNTVTVDPAVRDSLRVTAFNSAAGSAAVTVNPSEGSALVAGSLRYYTADGLPHNIIQRYNDSSSESFAVYHDGQPVTVTAEFNDTAVTSVSQATVGANLHTTSGTVDGVRFLSRIYLPHADTNPQTGAITVNYNGSPYTVVDYGALTVPSYLITEKGLELKLENCSALTAKKISAKNGTLYYNCDEYIDFTVIIMIRETNLTGSERDEYYNKYYDREYTLRSYLTLRPAGAADGSGDITVYGKQFVDTMRRSIELSKN